MVPGQAGEVPQLGGDRGGAGFRRPELGGLDRQRVGKSVRQPGADQGRVRDGDPGRAQEPLPLQHRGPAHLVLPSRQLGRLPSWEAARGPAGGAGSSHLPSRYRPPRAGRGAGLRRGLWCPSGGGGAATAAPVSGPVRETGQGVGPGSRSPQVPHQHDLRRSGGGDPGDPRYRPGGGTHPSVPHQAQGARRQPGGARPRPRLLPSQSDQDRLAALAPPRSHLRAAPAGRQPDRGAGGDHGRLHRSRLVSDHPQFLVGRALDRSGRPLPHRP